MLISHLEAMIMAMWREREVEIVPASSCGWPCLSWDSKGDSCACVAWEIFLGFMVDRISDTSIPTVPVVTAIESFASSTITLSDSHPYSFFISLSGLRSGKCFNTRFLTYRITIVWQYSHWVDLVSKSDSDNDYMDNRIILMEIIHSSFPYIQITLPKFPK